MHAQADPEVPLNSFLAFKAEGRDSGRIWVEDLLSVRLHKQSLAFLASCESSNVLNAEGLVSIAWALLGSGSSSVTREKNGLGSPPSVNIRWAEQAQLPLCRVSILLLFVGAQREV